MKYSDLICKWLVELGYTHCFSLGGGNIMHLVESASRYFTIVPVVHEVAAGIAAEYFNETENGKKAFALVTAGPGITNMVTAIAGAYLESRELLILGGQVKTSDLARGKLRQRGIQEIDGISLVKSITKKSILLDNIINSSDFTDIVKESFTPKKSPVFIEIPIDIQARIADVALYDQEIKINYADINPPAVSADLLNKTIDSIKESQRPVLLLGGGVSRKTAHSILNLLDNQTIPIMTTWNAADRLDANHPLYFGRPNIWGQRFSNILIQQADLLIAVGSRLGLHQSGFNWREFLLKGKIIQIDCDEAELNKGHPEIDLAICADANSFLLELLKHDLENHHDWLDFCQKVKKLLPLHEKSANETGENFISPYQFCLDLSAICNSNDVVIPCSSGGAYTTMMQSFLQKQGQIIINNKALASMGYGLSGAIGAAFASKPKRTILVEGDGGFSQNLQELATVMVNKLNLKIFIFDDNGYASIRMTQRNYFGGKYVGCDTNTGLGFPDWEKLFSAYSIPVMRISNNFSEDEKFKQAFSSDVPAAFIVAIDPKQTYFPKISSKILPNGSMESNPLHLMNPPLSKEIEDVVLKYL